MISGSHAEYGKLFRVMPNGIVDKGFESPLLTTTIPNRDIFIRSVDFQSDGKTVVSGSFTGINGIAKTNLARLNLDGSVDTSFSNEYSEVAYLEVLSNDQIVISRTGNDDLKKLNPDGTIDSSFSMITRVQMFVIDNAENIFVSQNFPSPIRDIQAIRKYDATGVIIDSFTEAIYGILGEVYAMGKQADGKIIIAGSFSIVGNKVRNQIARINLDGTLDETFNAPPSSGRINKIAFQDDGKIFVGGRNGFWGVKSSSGLARLNSDGSIDESFAAFLFLDIWNPPIISDIFVLPNGQILVGGQFNEVNETPQVATARLNSDGSLDTAFNPILADDTTVSSIVVQSDGKIMLGGNFDEINGVSRQNLARLNSDATLDTTFNAGDIPWVHQIFVRPNGQYLISRPDLITLRNTDGSIDSSFNAPTISGVAEILPLADRTIILVGSFASVNGVAIDDIALIKTDGSVDTTFLPSGVSGYLNTILKQDDGKIVVGGKFDSLENIDRSSLARFIFEPVRNVTDYDFDGDGKADIAVFRPSDNKWFVLRSSDFGFTQEIFAINGDSPIASDFDGDGKTDFSIFRNSLGDWWSLSSANGNQAFAHLGQNGDIPRPADFDGDGRADYVVYRPTDFTWYRTTSGNGTVSNKQFGAAGDKPLVGDFDGDGKSDVAIFRPSTGDWWWQSSIDNIQNATHWGAAGDIPSPGDFDGDGKTDFAVYRPSIGVWYVLNSGSGNTTFTIIQFGIAEDKPVPADYDGDGKTDMAVYRPSTGVWYILQSTDGFTAYNFGISTDIPIPNALIQ